MTTLPDGAESEPPPPPPKTLAFIRKLLRKPSATGFAVPVEPPQDHHVGPGEPLPLAAPAIGQTARHVVAGLPRSQTFKRQQSEQRMYLAPVATTADEKRDASVDRRSRSRHVRAVSQLGPDPRVSAPCLVDASNESDVSRHPFPQPAMALRDASTAPSTHHQSPLDQAEAVDGPRPASDLPPDTQSMTTSQHEAMINDELERKWILNLSMHFRDRSKREKFFVTYRETEHLWRRVTISLDYRYAKPNSLEMDLFQTRFQRDKSAKVYEAIRESLADIKFYDTVTNLKLETTGGRLHVHVVEDGNEIINYPRVSQVRHLGCRRVRDRDIVFDAHMSGFVYKVGVHGHMLIKKEIPSQDTIDEFLYEVNALNSLRHSRDVVRFYGVVVDDGDEYVKGLLISYASQGALVDIIFDHCKESSCGLEWPTREKWARQIVQGLADIHDAGFVQGDFTLSNIVIDDADDAKIIDINRRGCPVGWEPPEATALIEAGHRITMYIGVKSDLYQLGMVLWGLAMEEDEPEAHGRPLVLGPEINVPDWYRHMTEICLSADPRLRLQAATLLQMFPPRTDDGNGEYAQTLAISAGGGPSLSGDYFVQGYHADGRPLVGTGEPPSDFPYSGRTYVDTSPVPYDQYYPVRGRSPPSPLPSDFDVCESSRDPFSKTSWAANRSVRPSYTDVGADETMADDVSRQEQEHSTPTPTTEDGNAATGPSQARLQAWQAGTDGETVTPAAANGPADKDARASDVASSHDSSGAVRGKPGSTRDEVAWTPNPTRTETAVRLTSLGSSPHADDAAPPPVGRRLGGLGLGASTPTEPISGHSTARAVAEDALAKEPGGDGESHGQALGCGNAAEKLESATSGHGLGSRQEATSGAPAGRGGGGAGEAAATSSGAAMTKAEKVADATTHEHLSNWTMGVGSPSHSTASTYGTFVAQAPGAARGGGRLKADYPRQMSLPESLTGIGAAHMGIDDALLREQGLIDDDLKTMARPGTTSAALMITTD